MERFKCADRDVSTPLSAGAMCYPLTQMENKPLKKTNSELWTNLSLHKFGCCNSFVTFFSAVPQEPVPHLLKSSLSRTSHHCDTRRTHRHGLGTHRRSQAGEGPNCSLNHVLSPQDNCSVQNPQGQRRTSKWQLSMGHLQIPACSPTLPTPSLGHLHPRATSLGPSLQRELFLSFGPWISSASKQSNRNCFTAGTQHLPPVIGGSPSVHCQ